MQSIRDLVLAFAENERTTYINGANNGADDDLQPEERPNRAELMPNCLIKFSDELEIYGATVMYICPGRGATTMYGLTFDGTMFTVGGFEVTAVTDRIPADPNETAMPIFEEPP